MSATWKQVKVVCGTAIAILFAAMLCGGEVLLGEE